MIHVRPFSQLVILEGMAGVRRLWFAGIGMLAVASLDGAFGSSLAQREEYWPGWIFLRIGGFLQVLGMTAGAMRMSTQSFRSLPIRGVELMAARFVAAELLLILLVLAGVSVVGIVASVFRGTMPVLVDMLVYGVREATGVVMVAMGFAAAVELIGFVAIRIQLLESRRQRTLLHWLVTAACVGAMWLLLANFVGAEFILGVGLRASHIVVALVSILVGGFAWDRSETLWEPQSAVYPGAWHKRDSTPAVSMQPRRSFAELIRVELEDPIFRLMTASGLGVLAILTAFGILSPDPDLIYLVTIAAFGPLLVLGASSVPGQSRSSIIRSLPVSRRAVVGAKILVCWAATALFIVAVSAIAVIGHWWSLRAEPWSKLRAAWACQGLMTVFMIGPALFLAAVGVLAWAVWERHTRLSTAAAYGVAMIAILAVIAGETVLSGFAEDPGCVDAATGVLLTAVFTILTAPVAWLASIIWGSSEEA